MHNFMVGGTAKEVGKKIDRKTGKWCVFWRIESREIEGKMYARSYEEQYFDLKEDDYFQVLRGISREGTIMKNGKPVKKKDYIEVLEMIVIPYKDKCVDRLRAVNKALKGVK